MLIYLLIICEFKLTMYVEIPEIKVEAKYFYVDISVDFF